MRQLIILTGMSDGVLGCEAAGRVKMLYQVHSSVIVMAARRGGDWTKQLILSVSSASVINGDVQDEIVSSPLLIDVDTA